MLFSDDELKTIRAEALVNDARGGFPGKALKLDTIERFLAGTVPKRLGGAGYGTDQLGGGDLYKALVACGAADLSLGRLIEGHVNAARIVFTYGSPALQNKVADDLFAGHLVAIWNTERAQSPVRVGRRGSAAEVIGEKAFASGVGHVERAVISVIEEDGRQALAYITPDPAITSHDWWALNAMRASSTGSITLSGTMIEADDIFGLDGDYLKEPDFSAGAWRTLAVQLGGLQALCGYVKTHLVMTTHDRADAQKLRLGALVGHCQTLQLWVEKCASALDGRPIEAEAAVALVNTARSATIDGLEASLRIAKQTIGSRAFLPGSPAERLLRDLDFYFRQPAPDQTRMDVATHHLGGPPASISLS